uniref:Uncharacterized protein n=1 Tax=Pyricularia oryzae (strain P131) TaxID=1143193 RepID=L7IR73_PYRO1
MVRSGRPGLRILRLIGEVVVGVFFQAPIAGAAQQGRVRCAAIISKVGNLMTIVIQNPFCTKKASSRAALASSRGSHDAQSNGPLGVAKTHRRWSLLFGCVVLKIQNGSMRRGDHVVDAGDSSLDSLPTIISS